MSIRDVTVDHEAYLGRKYLPELDGLRAVSILLVISVHMKDQAWTWAAGHLGVTVFFVLSGYLITKLALREEQARGQLCLSAFFTRRFFRLFPLYYFVLGVYCLLIFGLNWSPEKRGPMARALPYYLAYFQEWPAFHGINGQFTNIPFYQSWSLGIEEKFYLVWPFLGFVAWRLGGAGRRWGTAILAVLFAASPMAPGGQIGRFLTPYAHILVGCLVALLLDDRAWFGRLAPLGGSTAQWVVLAGFLAFHFAIPHFPPGFPAPLHEIYTVATGFLLVSLVAGDGPIRRALGVPPLVLLGKLSYGMYLVHLLALNIAERVVRPGSGNFAVSMAALVLACAVSAVVAYALSMAIERPGIAAGRRLSEILLRRSVVARPVETSA